MKHFSVSILILLAVISANAQTWQPVGSGFNDYVRTLHVDSAANRLYAGGNFTLSAGDTVNRIAYWDGFQWNPMGDGFDRRVMDIEVYNGEIYAVGEFENSGSVAVNHIAKWNGASWEDVGGGLDEWAICLYVFNNDLYAGGSFEMAGTTPCRYVARWNGTVWSSLDTNLFSFTPWAVQTIYSYQNELIIGGRFTANGTIDNIARLSNGVWQSIGGSAVGDVTSMQEINGDLYVTGSFISIDSVGALNFAKWYGNNWYAIYGPMSSRSNCISYFNGNIILGGAINGYVNMGWGLSSPGIACFTMATQNWSGVDSGFGGHVNDLAIMNNTLYAGGDYNQAGNNGIYNIAQLDPSALSVAEVKTGSVSVFPNPANSEITFQFGDANQIRSVVIYNSVGQVVEKYSASQNTLQISTAEFAEGIYFFNCIGDKSEVKGKFVVTHSN